jgi:hypothetical protein
MNYMSSCRQDHPDRRTPNDPQDLRTGRQRGGDFFGEPILLAKGLMWGYRYSE